jgi:hypothetical protein
MGLNLGKAVPARANPRPLTIVKFTKKDYFRLYSKDLSRFQ